jgi:hypothetical protein
MPDSRTADDANIERRDCLDYDSLDSMMTMMLVFCRWYRASEDRRGHGLDDGLRRF